MIIAIVPMKPFNLAKLGSRRRNHGVVETRDMNMTGMGIRAGSGDGT